jgi:hypothetical protein
LYPQKYKSFNQKRKQQNTLFQMEEGQVTTPINHLYQDEVTPTSISCFIHMLALTNKAIVTPPLPYYDINPSSTICLKCFTSVVSTGR